MEAARTPKSLPGISSASTDPGRQDVEFDQSQLTHVARDGSIAGTIGRFGIADGRFNVPVDVVTDDAGRFYVTDNANHRVQVFGRDGVAIGVIGGPGDGDGEFTGPTYLAFGPDGKLYVSDDTANKVNIYDVSL